MKTERLIFGESYDTSVQLYHCSSSSIHLMMMKGDVVPREIEYKEDGCDIERKR